VKLRAVVIAAESGTLSEAQLGTVTAQADAAVLQYVSPSGGEVRVERIDRKDGALYLIPAAEADAAELLSALGSVEWLELPDLKVFREAARPKLRTYFAFLKASSTLKSGQVIERMKAKAPEIPSEHAVLFSTRAARTGEGVTLILGLSDRWSDFLRRSEYKLYFGIHMLAFKRVDKKKALVAAKPTPAPARKGKGKGKGKPKP